MTGVILTGDQFIRSPLVREQLHREFGAQAGEMEGAAVAQVADHFGVDCLVVRGLSDMAGEESHLDFARFTAEVAVNSARVVERVVLGLVLYGLSARDPSAPPGWMDRIQLVAVTAALVLDVMVLGVMVARIGELGFTPNRTAALGLNLVLLVDLAVTAWLSSRFLTGRGTFHRLERWQTDYLPVFAVWAAVVAVVLPPLFGFA